MARPREKFPPGARDMLMAMAPNGLRESTAAKALGMQLRDFRRVIRENEYARDLWQDCLAIERDKLLDSLYGRAVEGDTRAATFLLESRHGVTTKSPDSNGDRVHITFQLPAAMDPEKYLQALQVQHTLPSQQEALP